MARKMIFFINPISGTANKRSLQRKIYRACVRHGVAFEILYTSANGDYAFLRDKILQEQITDVIVCGGDGSLRPVVAAILDTNVNLGIVPVGSGNGLARTVGIPMKVQGALDVIFDQYTTQVDAFLVNNHLSCHLTGIGFDAQIAHGFAGKKNRGLRGYAGVILKQLGNMRSFEFVLNAGDHTFHESSPCIVIANSNQFGNNVKIAPTASVSDEILDIVVFRKAGKPATILAFIRQLLMGKAHRLEAQAEQKSVLYFQTSSLRIENPALAPIHVDGDPVESEPVLEVKIIPKAYRLLRPADK